MSICIPFDSGVNYFEYIYIRRCTKIPILQPLSIMGKLECVPCRSTTSVNCGPNKHLDTFTMNKLVLSETIPAGVCVCVS